MKDEEEHLLRCKVAGFIGSGELVVVGVVIDVRGGCEEGSKELEEMRRKSLQGGGDKARRKWRR